MKVITIASLKGGVGKTTAAVFLAQALSMKGQRVLLVDLDPNNNSTDYFLRDADTEAIEARNVYHALAGEMPLDATIWPTTFNLDVIPATPTLAKISLELARDPGSVLRFRETLREGDWNFVILDTPPALTLELTAGIYAADVILCPVSPARWISQGFQLLEVEVIKAAKVVKAPLSLFAVPSIVSQSEADIIQAVPIWTSTRAALLRSVSVKNAGTKAAPLKAATAWEGFFALADEMVEG